MRSLTYTKKSLLIPTSLLNSDLSTKFLIHLRRGLETHLKFELILGNSFSCFAAKLQDSSSQK